MTNFDARAARQQAQTQRQQGYFDAAAKTLEQAISQGLAEVADLYGMLGGTRREQGDLAAAAHAYDAGARIESDPPLDGATSYNELNRLIVRIQLAPEALVRTVSPPRGLEPVDVPQSLTRLQQRLRHQIDHERQNDYWAAGDLAITSALLSDASGAHDALDRFKACLPPTSARAAYAATLGMLAQLDTARRPLLATMKDALEA
jgi:tetratricopeptide (TPR) repeat protein